MWVELRREDIRVRKLQRNEDSWARGLMRRLLQMTHQQWSYRNATVHLKIEGCTRIEHNQLLEEIDQCLDSDPGVLIQDHRQLMFADFEKLAKGTVNDKRLWVAEFHAARSLARHVGCRERHQSNLADKVLPGQASKNADSSKGNSSGVLARQPEVEAENTDLGQLQKDTGDLFPTNGRH